jgi:hypothetical protein
VADTRKPTKPPQSRLKTTFWLDVALLVSVCALEAVPFTGLVLHEWLGLALAGMIFAHLLFSWAWIASTGRRLFVGKSARARVNYLLNMSLFAIMTALIFSGILISQKAIPVLAGMKTAPVMDWRWDTIHNQLSSYAVILGGLHLAINWDWALAAGEKLFRRIQEAAS